MYVNGQEKYHMGQKYSLKSIYLTELVCFFAQNENSSGINQMTTYLMGRISTTFFESNHSAVVEWATRVLHQLFANFAKTPFAVLVTRNGRQKFFFSKIGPKNRGKIQFGVGNLP